MVDHVTIIGPAPERRERLEEMGRVGLSEGGLQLVVPGSGPEALLAAVRRTPMRRERRPGRRFARRDRRSGPQAEP